MGVCFAVRSGNDTTTFNFVEGQVAADSGTSAFMLAAPEAIWARFLDPVPPRHHHGIFAMMYRLPEFSIQGDQLVFMQPRNSTTRLCCKPGIGAALDHNRASLTPPAARPARYRERTSR
jgi:hypothetical protein